MTKFETTKNPAKEARCGRQLETTGSESLYKKSAFKPGDKSIEGSSGSELNGRFSPSLFRR